MNKRTSTLSIAAVFAASVLALQSPIAGAAGDQSASQQGVPGVEMNVGESASDRGLPGVEMNIGAQGDQSNIDTRTLGAGPADTTMGSESSDTSTLGASGEIETGTDGSMRSPRVDRG
jgi:hypothetical protein